MTQSAKTSAVVCAVSAVALLSFASASSHAADLAIQPVSAPLVPVAANMVFSAEVFGGYLTGLAREYVYQVPGNGTKLSQLNWQIDNAAVLGARFTFQPWDWLSLRTGGWTTVASDNAMDDFDWMNGYNGFDSWTDWSHSQDTELTKAFQIDASAAARIYQSGPFELSALAGYRFMTLKMNEYGGHYIYSANGGFRNAVGNFDPNELGIAYQQWWHTPYLGIGAAYTAGATKLHAEVIASPFVMSHDKDHHNMRNLVFKEQFDADWMVGVTVGAEYALTDTISLMGRAEYQKYFEALGGSTMTDAGSGTTEFTPKPAAGGDINTLMLTVGLKARL
jgi:outer membrane protease